MAAAYRAGVLLEQSFRLPEGGRDRFQAGPDSATSGLSSELRAHPAGLFHATSTLEITLREGIPEEQRGLEGVWAVK